MLFIIKTNRLNEVVFCLQQLLQSPLLLKKDELLPPPALKFLKQGTLLQ